MDRLVGLGALLDQRQQAADQQTAQIKQGEQALKREDIALRKQELGVRAQAEENDRMQEARLKEQAEANKHTIAQMGNESAERINTADNVTAMAIADAEMESGERVAVSTGGGFDPGSDMV